MSNLHVKPKEVKLSRWYFGGFSAAGASCFTHPLDLLKVQMQTQKGKAVSLLQVIGIIIKNQGIIGLYNGISASLLRQLTYSTLRFAIYEAGKKEFTPKDGRPIPFHTSTIIAGVGGFAGGFVGNPSDVVNVRLQNDAKLPAEKRRNYKNVIHGIYKVASTEGVQRLWAGASMNCGRAALMTIGQIAFYDQSKMILLGTPYFKDNVLTHITSSLFAGRSYRRISRIKDMEPPSYMNPNMCKQKAPSDMRKMLSIM